MSEAELENQASFGSAKNFLYNLPRITYVIIKFRYTLTFSSVKLKDDHISLPKEAILRNSYNKLSHIHIPVTLIYPKGTTG